MERCARLARFGQDKEEQKKSSAHSTQPSEGAEQMEQIDSKGSDDQASNTTKEDHMMQVILAMQAKKLA